MLQSSAPRRQMPAGRAFSALLRGIIRGGAACQPQIDAGRLMKVSGPPGRDALRVLPTAGHAVDSSKSRRPPPVSRYKSPFFTLWIGTGFRGNDPEGSGLGISRFLSNRPRGRRSLPSALSPGGVACQPRRSIRFVLFVVRTCRLPAGIAPLAARRPHGKTCSTPRSSCKNASSIGTGTASSAGPSSRR